MMRELAALFIRNLVAFGGHRQGTAAVEFALLLPVMVLMYLGTAESTRGFYIRGKVQIVARTVSDLAARMPQVTTAELNDMLNAADAVLAPYPVTPLGVKLTGISIDATGKAKVAWSTARRAVADTCGADVNVPAAMKPAIGKSGFLVYAVTSYAYKPAVGYLITDQIMLGSSLYSVPRSGNAIPMTPAPC